MALCVAFGWHWVCLFVRLYKLCLAWGLSVCPSVQVMFGMGFVCLSVRTNYVWHGGLSVCPSVQVMFGMGFVCLSVRTNYVWHGGLSVCPSVQVMFGMGFVCLSVCTSYVWHGVFLCVRLYKLCLAWGLSVCPSEQVMFGMGFVCGKHSSLIVFGIFGSPEKDCLLLLKRTGYCSRSYILPSCQATAPSLLK